MPNWLRWILMPPTAIVSMIVVRWLNKVTFSIYLGSTGGGFGAIDDLVINAILAVMGFMFTVNTVSPTHKFQSCVVMSILLNVLYVLSVTNMLTRYGVLLSGWAYWEPIVSCTLSIITCIAFCANIYRTKETVMF
jgi:hypothetical protein